MSRLIRSMRRGAGPSTVEAEAKVAESASPEFREIAVPGRVVRPPALPVDDPLGGAPVEPSVVAALRRRAGTGRPLPNDVEGRLADHLGHDLSAVRVHDDPEAARITASLQASAFTHGNDLYFAEGAYRPGTDRGLHTLAHELGHVVAQRSGLDAAGSSPLTVGRADDPAERLADRTAASALDALRRTTAPESSPASAGAAASAAAVRRHPP